MSMAFPWLEFAALMLAFGINAVIPGADFAMVLRQSIAQGMHRQYGYVATRVLLNRFMDPSSRDDLDVLLEQYPEAAVEFACFSVNVGTIPRRNTVFWEVRNY